MAGRQCGFARSFQVNDEGVVDDRRGRLCSPFYPSTLLNGAGWLRVAVVIGLMALLSGCQAPAVRPLAAVTVPGARARVDRALSRLLQALPEVRCREWKLVPSAIPNASIDTGDTLMLTTGLLEFCETDDLLAFALAHELAHAALDHPRRLRRLGWLQLIASGAVMAAAGEATDSRSTGALAGAGTLAAAGFFLTLPAMRRMEEEADQAALDLLRRTGYRTEAAADFWRRYAAARPVRPLPVWFSAHPSDDSRVRRLSPPHP